MSDDRAAFGHAEYCELVAEAIGLLSEVSRGVDPATPIPTCPGWTLSKLLRHTGTVHRWATAMVAELAPERLDSRTLSLGLPDDDRWLPGWLDDGGKRLVDVLAAADPDAPMWAWGADQHARFWIRRMLHETTVHRVDAERDPGLSEIDAAVAADGIDEFFANLKPSAAFSPEVAEIAGSGSLGFESTGPPGAGHWLVRLSADGFVADRAAAGDLADVDVHVSGRPAGLLLVLYGRLSPDEAPVSVAGDPELLDSWIESSALN